MSAFFELKVSDDDKDEMLNVEIYGFSTSGTGTEYEAFAFHENEDTVVVDAVFFFS